MTTKSRLFTINEFRRMIGLEDNKYTRYYNLKQRVILVAQSELQKQTDIINYLYHTFLQQKKGLS